MPLRAPRTRLAPAATDAISVALVRQTFPEFQAEDVVEAAGPIRVAGVAMTGESVSYGVPDEVITRAIRAAEAQWALDDGDGPARQALLYLIAAMIVLDAAPSNDDGGHAPIESTGSGVNAISFAGQVASVDDAAFHTNKYGRQFLRLRAAAVATW